MDERRPRYYRRERNFALNVLHIQYGVLLKTPRGLRHHIFALYNRRPRTRALEHA